VLKLIIVPLQNYAILCLKVSNFLYVLRHKVTIFRRLSKNFPKVQKISLSAVLDR